MSGLASVSWIVLFDEKRVVGLLDELRPTVWAKGGDYTLETLDQDERRMAESHGIEIALIPPVEGISTTGGTPLAVADGTRVLGVIHLKDTVKEGMAERFDELIAVVRHQKPVGWPRRRNWSLHTAGCDEAGQGRGTR